MRSIRPAEAARLIGVSRETLRQWRERLDGPPYHVVPSRNPDRPGEARYRVADVERWIEARRVETTGG